MVVGFIRFVFCAISPGIDIRSLAILRRRPTIPLISASQYLTLRDCILADAAFCRMSTACFLAGSAEPEKSKSPKTLGYDLRNWPSPEILRVRGLIAFVVATLNRKNTWRFQTLAARYNPVKITEACRRGTNIGTMDQP